MVASDDEDEVLLPQTGGQFSKTKKTPTDVDTPGDDVGKPGVYFEVSSLNPIEGFARLQSWLKDLFEVYGWKLCIMLVLAQHVLKGFCFAYLATSLEFVFKFYNVTGPRIQIYKACAFCPWSLKPVFGMISDKYPLFGYHKTSYMVLTTLMAIVALGYVGLNNLWYYADNGDEASKAPLKQHLPLEITVICFFIAFMQMAVCDLLTEARYAEAMRKHPEKGPDLMTYVWIGISGGALIGLASIGWILDTFGPFVPSMVCCVVCSFILVPLSKNYMQERNVNLPVEALSPSHSARRDVESAEPASSSSGTALLGNDPPGGATSGGGSGGEDERPLDVDRKEFDPHQEAQGDNFRVAGELVGLTIFMGVSALFLVGAGMFPKQISVGGNFVISIIVGATVLSGFIFFTSPPIAKMNFFFFVQTALAISTEGGTFYFFTDSEKEYPDGPHFSTWFYTTGIGLVASVFNIAGMIIYNQYMKHWKYHSLLLIANATHAAFSILGIMVYTRFSKHVLGIPDHVFVLGGAVITSIVHQWMWMPGVILLSQLCPKGVEATMYALLAGSHNVGNAVGQFNGAFVLYSLGIQPNGKETDAKMFDNLWIAAVIQCILPLGTLALLPWLIPNASQKEKILDDKSNGVNGSLYRTLFGLDDAEKQKKDDDHLLEVKTTIAGGDRPTEEDDGTVHRRA